MLDSNAIDNINNFTGQGASQSAQARETLSGNYQDFLRLLTTQLQNQDPTAPIDTNQLTQQIATLSQVEQQINTNKNLERLITLFNATQYNSLVSYIGKQVEAKGNVGSLQDGEAQFVYYLDANASAATVTIKDSTGGVVYTGPGPTQAGRNPFVWDGKNSAGVDMPDGAYTIEIKAVDGSNNPIQAQAYATGIVTSVDSAGGAVYLSFGDVSIPIENVVSIRSAPPTT